ncbi:DUF4190 domain-containing protein [Nocardioides alkalitolerans]|uniref:DUF4190 domain-containing protein n=1 Tax=Nocardioides alkalitolerans TaxID=281714 RepID=UPI00040A2F27|nr:DUF4190 domain-containing protein [Nocardioides alkalitolerans]
MSEQHPPPGGPVDLSGHHDEPTPQSGPGEWSYAPPSSSTGAPWQSAPDQGYGQGYDQGYGGGSGYGQGWGQGQQWQPQPRKPVSKLAVTALVLAIIPVTFPIGLVLGVVALVRCGGGKRGGWGVALAAVLVGVGWAVIVGLSAAISAFSFSEDAERDESGSVVSADTIDVFALRVGDCFNDDSLFGDSADEYEEVMTVDVVPCSEAHDAEVYALFDLEGTEYPGDDEVFELAEEGCEEELDASGVSDEVYYEAYVNFLSPTRDSWFGGDREIACMAYFDDRTTGSILDAP